MWANGKKAHTDGARQNTRGWWQLSVFLTRKRKIVHAYRSRATTFKFRVRTSLNNNNINNKNNFIEKPQPFGKYLIK